MKKYTFPLFIFCLLCGILTFSLEVKKDDENYSQVNTNINNSDDNCLSIKDSNAVNLFFKQIENIINEKDTLGLANLVHTKIETDHGGYTSDNISFVMTYYNVLASYILGSTNDTENEESVERIEEYIPENDNDQCFYYSIWHHDAIGEFSVSFKIKRIHKQLKIVSCIMAG